MKQNFFEYNGEKYFTGTQIKILKYPYDNAMFSDLAYFVYYDTEHNIVWYKMAYTNQNRGCSMQTFLKQFGGATGYVSASINIPQTKQLKDNQIPLLFIGWIWYIFLMAIMFIFKGRLFGWAIVSIVFFNWRDKVIKEEGYYVEW